MNEQHQAQPDVAFQLKKIQDQLTSLERKVDALLNQAQEKTFNKERTFSKTFRPFRHDSRPGKGPRDSGPREKPFSKEGSFEKRRSNEDRGYPKKKPFFKNDKGGFKQ